MEIMEFCNKVKRSLGIYIGDEASISIKKVVKNNGIVLHGIMISEQQKNISPNIYLNGLYEAYEKGETFSKVMEEILHIYKESRIEQSMDMSFFLDYKHMKERVLYKVISYENNKELLLQIPYIPFLDMAIVFYCYVPGKELDNATILIYNSHIKLWNITKEKLYQDAKQNMPYILPPRLLSIEEMMKEIFTQDIQLKCGKDDEKDKDWINGTAEQIVDSITGSSKSNMYVLGNQKKLFGAAVILYEGILEKIAETMGRSLYLLPSSIHEFILVPDENMQKAEELWKMVCEINATQVEPEDVLTDSIYYFSRKNNKLEKIF